MSSATSPPGGGKKPLGSAPAGDDPFLELTRAARSVIQGTDPHAETLADTSRHLRDGSGALTGESAPSEILQLVNESLVEAPERADLWMMRFEVQRSLGLKKEFADALTQGWSHPRLSRQLDWNAIRNLWDELAPGEPAPVRLPEPMAPVRRPEPGVSASPSAARDRRFADVATRVAGRELAVLAKAYAALQSRPGFFEDYARKVGPMLRRPTPLQRAEGLARLAGGDVRLFLKREDQRTVTPEDENAAAQAYIAVSLGRRGVITGNDVDAHSVALAAMASRFNLQCTVVVRRSDPERKPGLIDRLRALGATVELTPESGMVGADPREGALRLWLKSMGQAHLALSLGTGPPPYPAMVNNFQSLLGRETELQARAAAENRHRTMIAAVQSEADSIGFMLPQLNRGEVELMYAEPEPGGLASWRPSARLRAYNGAVREHAWLRGLDRLVHIAISDDQARAAQQQLAATERVNASLEDARAVALALLMTRRDHLPREFVILVA